MKWFQQKSQKEIEMKPIFYKTPTDYVKLSFFGYLACIGIALVLFYYNLIFTRYSVGLVVMIAFAIFKSGFSQSRIKKTPFGNFGKSVFSLVLSSVNSLFKI